MQKLTLTHGEVPVELSLQAITMLRSPLCHDIDQPCSSFENESRWYHSLVSLVGPQIMHFAFIMRLSRHRRANLSLGTRQFPALESKVRAHIVFHVTLDQSSDPHRLVRCSEGPLWHDLRQVVSPHEVLGESHTSRQISSTPLFLASATA